MSAPIKITDERGRIVDPAVLAAYERVLARNERLVGGRAAEAFLRLVERYAARGVCLCPPKGIER